MPEEFDINWNGLDWSGTPRHIHQYQDFLTQVFESYCVRGKPRNPTLLSGNYKYRIEFWKQYLDLDALWRGDKVKFYVHLMGTGLDEFHVETTGYSNLVVGDDYES